MTLGVYIGTPITIAVLAAIALCFWAVKRWEPTNHDVGLRLIGLWVFGACFVTTIALWLACMWPLQPSYHRWHERVGIVEHQESRLLGSSENGVSEVFLIKFESDETHYRCDDTRCATARPGTHLRLLCKPEFEYAGTDGWVCRYGQEN